ncbi:unnamed protein product [Withania somnifera]
MLISRDYRGDVSAQQVEKFFTKLPEKAGDLESHGPVCYENGVNYMFIQQKNINLLAASRQNSNAFEELEEESPRDNFVVVILSEFIKTDAYRMVVNQHPPMAVTSAVSRSSEGVIYKNNEFYLDEVEHVNLLVNSNGQLIRSEVNGALKMSTYLRYVRLVRFENDRTISFIPPDGSFDLMTYKLTTRVKPLIWVDAQVERHSRSRVEMSVKGRSHTATNVEIELPVPSDATSPNIRTLMGYATYAPERDAVVWKIKSFCGYYGRIEHNDKYMLRAQFRLPSVISEDTPPDREAPIRVKFDIPYFTVSGIQLPFQLLCEVLHVNVLKIIEKSGYQALPWVRYITKAGEDELRLT